MPDAKSPKTAATAPASGLRESQLLMANFLRDPSCQPAPAGVEPRRLKIYQDLIYNNIEGFISSGFPVLRSLYTDQNWHSLVRLFIDQHRCHTPYFLEISQEFIRFLMDVHALRPCDPPFIAQLAHYEWVELALDVALEELPEPGNTPVDVGATIPGLSPLAWLLRYDFPVHRIGPSFVPEQSEGETFLVVYRDRDDAVNFVEVNAATAQLLRRVRDNVQATVHTLLGALAQELQMAPEPVVEFGVQQLTEFADAGIVLLH